MKDPGNFAFVSVLKEGSREQLAGGKGAIFKSIRSFMIATTVYSAAIGRLDTPWVVRSMSTGRALLDLTALTRSHHLSTHFPIKYPATILAAKAKGLSLRSVVVRIGQINYLHSTCTCEEE